MSFSMRGILPNGGNIKSVILTAAAAASKFYFRKLFAHSSVGLERLATA